MNHSDSTYVLEPHHSVQNLFGYTASRATIWGLIGSMFLHGGIMHLAGNMLYLWVFGRALEENLGSAIFAGAYIICGIAATLLYHVITVFITPQSAGVPLVGASGAIAGVLGLFALRFYRTPVKIFYIQPISLAIVTFVAIIGGFIGAGIMSLLGGTMALLGFIAGFLAVWVGFLIHMRKTAFGTFNLASAYSIGIWLVAFNVFPGVVNLFSSAKEGGTAYWAHIGGFAYGMIYGLLIGSKAEGSLEYALEDAQKSFENKQMEKAIEEAQNVLTREPDNAGAFEVIAKAYDASGNENSALDNYEIAIQKYFRAGERDSAVAIYLHSLQKNPGFILPPKVQFALANHMARNLDYQNAADNFAKIPFTFPDAPEGELALLRGAQIYLEHLRQNDVAAQLLHTLLERYPETEWMAQVQRALGMAHYQQNSGTNP
ncbi:MAG TPA: rhomboid family intramembrane serine protease [Abditibacteriaceae bacterium]